MYLVTYKRHDGATRTYSTRAMNEEHAKELADQRLEKQYGPQPYKFYHALRDEQQRVVLDANGDPIMSNEYEIRYMYPENRNGEQDDTLLQSNYDFFSCERTK